MCASEGDCGAQGSCIAGRCVARGATPAIDTARRLLFAPVDIAYLRQDTDTSHSATALLGGARDKGAVVLVRFSAPLPAEAKVLEAYLVLERVTDVDADPVPITLHAARIVEPWDSRTVSWARQPVIEEFGAPVTRVSPASGEVVRLDIRAIVQRWRRRTGKEHGIAVLAEGASHTGMAFALAPVLVGQELASSSGGDLRHAELSGPRLELYVK